MIASTSVIIDRHLYVIELLLYTFFNIWLRDSGKHTYLELYTLAGGFVTLILLARSVYLSW